MADRLTRTQRSLNMSRIRSRDTAPEKALRSALFRLGCRFRVCCRHLPGKPDIVFPSAKLAVQVNGCFWHQHPGCKHASVPDSNREYWKPKLERNVERDAVNSAAIRSLGWCLVEVWECGLQTGEEVDATAHAIAGQVRERRHGMRTEQADGRKVKQTQPAAGR